MSFNIRWLQRIKLLWADDRFWITPNCLLNRYWQQTSSPLVNQSGCLPPLLFASLLALMRLFTHSFKFQMDPLYISWQLSHSRKKKSPGQREHARGGGEWSAEWSGTEWKTFPLLSVSVFPLLLSPHPGSKPWTFEKTSPIFETFPWSGL